MGRLSEAKFLAPTLHAVLFITAWVLYAVSSQPMMDGLSGVPFMILMIADLPISIVAFAVLFTSARYGFIAVVFWGVVGTFWWYFLGRSMDRLIQRFRTRRETVVADAPVSTQSDQHVRHPIAWGGWILAAVCVVSVFVVAFTWYQRTSEKSNNASAIGGFTFSPDGRSLLLARSEDSSEFLYKVALDSGRAVRLTTATAGFESSPSYSKDGKHIVYSYAPKRDGRSGIFIMEADGRASRPLFNSDASADALFPKFASSGKIYFARSGYFGNYSPIARPSHHEWDIYTVDLDGQNLHALTNQKFYEITEPSLSSDGKQLLFSVVTASGSQMYIYGLDSDAPPRLVQPHVPNEPRSPIFADASLAPDGRSIIFLAASQGSKAFDYDVYRLDLASNSIEKLTNANGYATNLNVAPDGKRAAFLRWSSSYGSLPTASQMYLLDLETKQLTALPIKGTR